MVSRASFSEFVGRIAGERARQAWTDYGEVIVCDSYEEMVKEADRIASEHIYRYFPTKQALIQEVYKVVYLGLWNERWDEILIDSRLPLRSRLIGFFDQYTDVIMNSQWLRLYLYAGLRGVEINELYIKLVEEKIIKRIVVEFWKQHGLGRPDIIPSTDMETVWILQGGIFYYGVRQFVYNLPVYVSKRDMIANAVDMFIAGYGAMLEQRNKTPMSTTTAAN